MKNLIDRDQPHFVWTRGVGGRLYPQKWSTMMTVFKSTADQAVASHPITDGDFANLSLDYLAKMYPAPQLEKA